MLYEVITDDTDLVTVAERAVAAASLDQEGRRIDGRGIELAIEIESQCVRIGANDKATEAQRR